MNKLEEIIIHKRNEISERKDMISLQTLQSRAHYNRDTLSLTGRILKAKNGFGIIAEFKRRSPSAGKINDSVDPVEQAHTYVENGASAISVLTDEKYFGGNLNDLESIRNAVNIPLLRKDFIIDEYQLHEAKSYGADAVLLIADVLTREELHTLFDRADAIGLESLVEVYDTPHIEKLDLQKMKLIGINNRDLRTFTVDLNHTKKIMQYLPEDTIVISESGIGSPEDIKTVKSFGARGALIGEYFMKHGYNEAIH